MEKKALGVGIIGCGGIANGKHMPAIKKIEGLEMVAFCDVVRERAEKAAKEFGVPDAAIDLVRFMLAAYRSAEQDGVRIELDTVSEKI